jgi:two-component system, OmpR family, phosphate regulon sensor histidine kinase PhoR
MECQRPSSLLADSSDLQGRSARVGDLVPETPDAAGESMALAAHELRTPVAAIKGYAQLLLRRLDSGRPLEPSALESTLRRIDQQTSRLSLLVNDLLEVGRMDSGRLPFRPVMTDLRELVTGTAEQSIAAAPGRDILLDAPEPIQAEVDPTGIQQVLTNLLDNAFKFSPADSIVEMSLQHNHPGVQICVRDHGPGIAIEARARIFDRFFQAGYDRPHAGLGLGLFLSRALVELHGGRITAEFPADGGTRFVVNLPLKD